ncbi:MAG TPA: glutaredoxin family protein [Albitalea sp.]|nr:glutaredoxin family protein [Albitalea sp.]
MVWGGVQCLGLWQAQRLGRQVADEARSGDIVMVSSVTCPYCKEAREWFTEHKVTFSECFIETEPACAEAYNALQAPGTPVLVVRGQRQRGFDARRVAAALMLSGTEAVVVRY